jgi:hypothetical protein
MNDDNILDYTLAKATEKYSRPDGWTLLSHAGTLIAEKCPIALSNTYKKYGCHSLKNLITKLENFECQMEATANGERVIYKVK